MMVKGEKGGLDFAVCKSLCLTTCEEERAREESDIVFVQYMEVMPLHIWLMV